MSQTSGPLETKLGWRLWRAETIASSTLRNGSLDWSNEYVSRGQAATARQNDDQSTLQKDCGCRSRLGEPERHPGPAPEQVAYRAI